MTGLRGADRRLSIYVITEIYPSLYKPYFDTQFAQFLASGHTLRIFALRTAGRDELSPAAARAGLGGRTRAIPADRRSLPRFTGSLIAGAVSAPARRATALRRARNASPPRVRTLTDAARLIALPASPPDLCLVHNLIAARRVRFLRDLYPGVPVAFYYHGGELPGVPEVSHADAAEAFAAADIVLTNTEASRAHAISRGCRPDQIRVCPVGFDLGEFPDPVDRPYRRGGRLNLLSAGRLSPEKGFGFAIEAVRRLAAGGELAFHYRILSGGPLAAALQAQIDAAGLRDMVELTGSVSRERLIEEMGQADALVLPSVTMGTWVENQACVVQEAMLMRALVVATATGGVPESLAPELHRFLAPEGDPAAMADRIRELAALDESELRSLGAAGRRFAAERYDIRMLNAQLLDTVL